MARDHSPRERQRQQLQRKRAQRAAYERILIVCEGSKTEPLYFNELRVRYRLPTANVQVRPSEAGTLPSQVVDYAQQLFLNGNPHRAISARTFDRVYAVFDRDEHRNYRDALRRAESLDNTLRNTDGRSVKFRAIASVPCFELWLLLHYEDILAPIDRREVMQRLKKHLPTYEKSAVGTFLATQTLLPTALVRAARLAEKFTPLTDPAPYTGVVDLVKELIALKGSA